LPPLQHIDEAIGQARDAHGLVQARDRAVAVGHAGVAQKDTPELEHAHPLRFSVQIETQNL
jgi:hypothetical protein